MSAIDITLAATGEAATQSLAGALAHLCKAGDCILLCGDLGAGKTAFARGFIHALLETPEEVVSPTFTLVQTYTAQNGTQISHFDLYRLKSPGELAEIGLEDALSGITLIEWPELAQTLLPAHALTVTITPGETPEARKLTFSGEKQRMEQLKKAWQ